MINEIISTYGAEILKAVLTAVFAWLGVQIKRLASKYLDDKRKQEVAHTVVRAVEQIYHDLHGEDKLNAALANASDLLAEKGINFSETEMRVLIEAAVGEMNLLG